MLSSPAISIIMPNFNGERFIAQAVKSVLGQTFTNWELIIIDDFSTDSSAEIITKFLCDPRIRLIKNPYNQGVAAARNIGIKHAEGQYISFLDSDDIWEAEKLQKQYDLLNASDFWCSHTDFVEISEEGEILRSRSSPKIITRSNLLLHNYIGNLSGLYDANFLGKHFQKPLMHEDYDMWLEILRKTDSIKPIGNLASYRVRSNSLSSNKIKSLVGHYRVLRGFQISVYVSVLFTFCHVCIKLGQKIGKY